jgi:hypothetical protein
MAYLLLIVKAIASALIEYLGTRLDRPSTAEEIKPTAETLSLAERLRASVQQAKDRAKGTKTDETSPPPADPDQ